jgi:CHAT domain-containing protein/tetratricopeptide (TPR) repeat protein
MTHGPISRIRERLAAGWNNRAAAWIEQAQDLGDPAPLARAAPLLRAAVRATRDPARCRDYRFNLSRLYQLRHELDGDPDAAAPAVECARLALAGMPRNDEDRPAHLSNLSTALIVAHDVHGRDGDLREAYETAVLALDSAPPDLPGLPVLIVRLGGVLRRCAVSRAGSVPDSTAALDEGFEAARAAARTATGHEPGLVRATLAQAIFEVCVVVGWPAGLDEAVESFRAALEESSGAAHFRHNLGLVLLRRFEWTGDSSSVTEAVETLRAAVAQTGPGTPDRYQYTCTLGSALATEYEISDDPGSLAEAVEILQALLRQSPPDPLDATSCRISLAVALEARAKATCSVDDAQAAVKLLTEALADAADDDRPVAQLDLANVLVTLYELTGELGQVRLASAHLREAAAAFRGPSPVYASTLSSLSDTHLTLFLGEGRAEDLHEAVATARRAVENSGGSAPGYPGYLVNLANALMAAFEASGQAELIEEATGHARAAVAASVFGGVDRAHTLDCLGQCLCAAHEATGELAPLDEAIAHQRRAVEQTPPDDFLRATFLSNLAISLCLRHEHTPDESVLRDALDTARNAVAATADGDPGAHLHLQTLDRVLGERYRYSDARWALDEAIETMRTALGLLGAHDPARPACQLNLAANLLERHSAYSGGTALDEAIGLLSNALADRPFDAPDRALALYDLGLAIAAREKGDPRTTADAVTAFQEAVTTRTAPALLRAESAIEWGRVAAAAELWALAAEGFTAAVGLLPLVSPRHLDRGDQEHLLGLVDGAARDAAACLLEAGTGTVMSALEVIEQGRGVLYGSLVWPGGDVARLRAVAPELAGRFEQVRDALDSGRSDQMIRRSRALGAAPAAHLAVQQAAGTRKALLLDLDELVAGIRALPGFDRFLEPPPVDRIASTAKQDTIIVVNVSRYRSDALVLAAGEPIAIRLRDLDWDRLTAVAARYPRILSRLRRGRTARVPHQVSAALRELHGWLWVSIAQPVLDELGHDAPKKSGWPRVWWCPTGPLSSLPLHAAHPYGERSEAGDGVIERVIPSYLPTLRTLAELKRRQPERAGPVRTLVVATAGPDGSRHMARELSAVTATLDPPPTILREAAATRAAVLDALPSCRRLHFIGHGYQDLINPALGGLRLADGDLTALTLIAVRLSHAELAYLSSCEGAAGGVAALDDPLPPALACLAAGFHDVIGTLWSVGDSAAADIAERFYRRLSAAGETAAAGRVAEALHGTVREMRSACPPEVWAAYVHLGG